MWVWSAAAAPCEGEWEVVGAWPPDGATGLPPNTDPVLVLDGPDGVDPGVVPVHIAIEESGNGYVNEFERETGAFVTVSGLVVLMVPDVYVYDAAVVLSVVLPCGELPVARLHTTDEFEPDLDVIPAVTVEATDTSVDDDLGLATAIFTVSPPDGFGAVFVVSPDDPGVLLDVQLGDTPSRTERSEVAEPEGSTEICVEIAARDGIGQWTEPVVACADAEPQRGCACSSTRPESGASAWGALLWASIVLSRRGARRRRPST